MVSMFDKLSLSILNYGLEVWSLNESTKLEGIHIHFCKHILGVRGQTQNNLFKVNEVEPVLNQEELLTLLDIGLKVYNWITLSSSLTV